MRYTDDEIAALDLDWYAVDDEGRVAHFASAGRALPESVAQHKEDNEYARRYFRSLAAVGGEGAPDPEFEKYVVFDNPESRSRYLDDFKSMSMRGLYSYDTMLPPSRHALIRIYSPQNPLKLSGLPPEIAMIVLRTAIASRFSDHSVLKLESFS